MKEESREKREETIIKKRLHSREETGRRRKERGAMRGEIGQRRETEGREKR
jgi:hypothetical protein